MTRSSHVVVVGGVAAGPKAAATLARRRSEWAITLFEQGEQISYGSCGMPYFASGDIAAFEELTKTGWGSERTPQFFDTAKGFTVRTNTEVTSIDREGKRVMIRDRRTGKTGDHSYDKLVLATGARPKKPPFECDECEFIRHFTRPADAIAFRRLAEQGKVGSAVIIGGGFIGCELAEAAASLWGIETTLLEAERRLLPYALDAEMALLVQDEMKRQGVTVTTGARVSKVTNADGRAVINFDADGAAQTIEADYIFLCVGVTPEVRLAAECGLTIGPTGAIAVDQQMRTSDPDIFAGGDCVESRNLITDQPMYLPMGSLANRHGRVIAEAIAGHDTRFAGVVGSFVVKVFDSNAGAVGLSERAAMAAGINSRAVWGAFSDRPDYYPEHASIVVKLVYDPTTMHLLGLQAVGAGDVCRRLDVFSSLLQRQATVADLLDHEHAYAPPFSEALDPLHHLAAMALAQERGTSFVCAAQARSSAPNGALWLDVREVDEIEASPLDIDPKLRQVRIPLAELRGRLNEIDRGSEIFIVCRRGPRAYQAALLLQSHGFEKIRVVGGGTTAMGGT